MFYQNIIESKDYLLSWQSWTPFKPWWTWISIHTIKTWLSLQIEIKFNSKTVYEAKSRH
jgi:hypothetical protein